MVIPRLLVVFIVAIAQQHAFTAPNVRPPSQELRELRGSEHAVPFIVAIITILTWSWAFLEGSVLFALSGYCPPALAHPLLHALHPISLTSDPSTTLTTLTPTFLTGALLTLTGAILRAHCFHTLGPCFTFELSIRPSHTLVTEGVYGIIRHPSYTAALAVVVGWSICVFDRQGSVVAVCMGRVQAFSGNGSQGGNGNGNGNGNAMMMGVFASVWAMAFGTLCLWLIKRMNKEDAMLEKNFGKDWRAWASRVPYRLVPGVY